MASSSPDSIVIVGAGIIGLNVAFALAERGLGRQVTVVAEYLPGDTSPYYTSPWAGCNFSAISGTDANALRWDKLGYAHLTKLASERPEDSFVQRTPSIEYWEEQVPRDKIKHMSEYLEDFRILPEKDLPHGISFGISCTTLTINAPKHTEFLYRWLKEHHGVQFVRQKLPSIDAAYLNSSTKIVFNCTGLAAKTFKGIEDRKVFPTRGQVVLVKAPKTQRISMLHGKNYETYIIPRPGSNGNVVLGGYMQKGNGDPSTYSHETESILSRTKILDTSLRDNEPEVLAAFAGLRPSREGGARIELDTVLINGTPRALVHNYGAGGTGFQAGYGMALESVKAAESHLSQISASVRESKL